MRTPHNHFLNLPVFLVLLFFAVSCVDELPEPPLDRNSVKVLVKCVLTPAEEQQVILKYVIGGRETVDVEDARVSLTSEDGKTVYTDFVKASAGLWKKKFIPDYGKRYRLQVLIPEMDTVWAVTTMPEALRILYADAIDWSEYQRLYGRNPPINYLWRHLDGRLFEVYPNHDCNLWITSSKGLHLGTNHINADLFNVDPGRKFYAAEYYSETGVCSRYEKLDGTPLHNGPLRIKHKGGERVNGVPFDMVFNANNGLNNLASTELDIHRNKGKFNVVGDFRFYDYTPRLSEKEDLLFHILSDELDEYYLYVEKSSAKDKTDLLDLLYSATTGEAYTNVVNGEGIFGAQLCYGTYVEGEYTMFYGALSAIGLAPYKGQGVNVMTPPEIEF